MLRGIYTGAAGMVAQMHQMDVVSNNLANVDKVGYKRDTSIFKSFPEMLIRRADDNGVVKLPIGSYDVMPMVGKIGTGVELNEVYTRHTQGALRQTGNPFDLALNGKGFFVAETPEGLRFTRNGSFLINKDRVLVTKDGYPVMGENGEIRVSKHNFTVDDQGQIFVNSDKEGQFTTQDQNENRNIKLLDRFRLVNFENLRYLKKVGTSFYRETRYSGKATDIQQGRPQVKQKFLEMSNVNPVTEMVRMIEVQRTYEASQKAIHAHDQTLAKLVELARM